MEQVSPIHRSTAAKTLAFFLCALSVTAALCLGLVTFAHWEDLWLGGNYQQSGSASQQMYADTRRVYELAALQQAETWGRPLSYSERERVKVLTDMLSPQKTNFRYQLHDQKGELLLDNLDGNRLEDVSLDPSMEHNTLWEEEALHQKDYSDYKVLPEDPPSSLPSLHIYLSDGEYLTVTAEESLALEQPNDYGWRFDGQDWSYYSDFDVRVRSREVVLEYGLASDMAVDDHYTRDMASYAQLQRNLPIIALLALLSLLGGLGLLVFLLRGAGWRKDGTLALGWQEWLPYELYLLMDAFLLLLLYSGAETILYSIDRSIDRSLLAGLSLFAFGLAVVAVALLLTTAVRLKKRALWRTSLAGWLCRGIWRFVYGVMMGLPVTRRVVILFFLYLLGSVLTGLTLVLIPVYQGFVLWYLCRWLRQWRRIEVGIGRIAGGDGSFKIDTAGMFSDLRRHAEQLNDLGGTVNSAVEDRIRSERFKAELITNVSHDLKTPLTSIINYVGLLKALPTENPQAAEYLDVLDRKSQRLRRLTEDLVEASKASTGSLTVSLERLGMGELLTQALGEYEDKFAASRLEVIFPPPAEELYVWGDGRHLWRVIDNLFSNCAKYAMEGTRIYLELFRREGNIFLSAKNISRRALNVPPDQLMERFVRGEESRSTEGSGLGLSIARSLTELQQGSFRLEIDGDLFKVLISLPEALALPDGGNFELDTPDNQAV